MYFKGAINMNSCISAIRDTKTMYREGFVPNAHRSIFPARIEFNYNSCTDKITPVQETYYNNGTSIDELNTDMDTILDYTAADRVSKQFTWSMMGYD